MRITSLNLRGFFDWDARRGRIVDFLGRMDADLVMMQEVVFLPDLSPFTQPELLNRDLHYPVSHGAVTRLQDSPEFGVYREGLALFSRPGVAVTEALSLRRQPGDPHQRIVQLADLADGDAVHRVANVHLSVRDDFAIEHLKELLGILEARGERRIIGGDFNVNHLERHASLWHEGYVLTSELGPYVSYPHSGQANDYFLVPREYAIRDLRLSDEDLSDHRALTVELEHREGSTA